MEELPQKVELPYPDEIQTKALANLEKNRDELLSIGAIDAIDILQSCHLTYRAQIYPKWFSEYVGGLISTVFIYLQPIEDDNLEIAKIVYNPRNPLTKIILDSIREALPRGYYTTLSTTEYQYEKMFPATESTESIDNQAVEAKNYVTWKNFRFRSNAEVRVAQALDKVKDVLFLPNCKARLGPTDGRANKEPDFLVCYRGRWGILEVDGPHHRAADDHERDRLFRLHGILVVERFESSECFENAERVVQQFLYLLRHLDWR
jgi:hypothetical protein